MKTGTLLLALFISIFQGCSKNNPDTEPGVDKDATVYLIKKGNHFTEENSPKLLRSQEINFQVIFDSSAVYESLTTGNQLDVNKLIGFSDCNTAHHENSARIGWSWNGKAVQLYAYAYVNKERIITNLSTVALGEAMKCSVKAIADQYYFTTGIYTDSLTRHCPGFTGNAYKLYPYFGGDETAPHDVRISIREF